MEPRGDREVKAVVLTRIEPPQKLKRCLEPLLLRSDCLCAAQSQIVHGARPRLATSKFRNGGG